MRALWLVPSCLMLVAPRAQCRGLKTEPASATSAAIASASAMAVLDPSGAFLAGSDSCTAPTPIAGRGTFGFDTSVATTGPQGQTENRCFDFGTRGIDNDVWFCWTADATGCTKLTTCTLTPGLDTKVAVYPGCGCPAPGTSLACNEDSCTTGYYESTVYWPTTIGTTYTIQIGSFPGAAGGLGRMSFSTEASACPTPANDECTSPVAIIGAGIFAFDSTWASLGYEGQNELNCSIFGLSTLDHDVWYAWLSTCTGTVTLSTCGLTVYDTRIAVYPGSGCPIDGSSIACDDNSCGTQSQLSFSALIGITYLFQIGTFPDAPGGMGSFSVSVAPCLTGGMPECFGDGGGMPCPCFNSGGVGEGCANGTGAGGALSSAGDASVTNDTLTLTADGVVNENGLFFQGNSTLGGGAGVAFGDGLRCCGGGVVRIQVVNPPGTSSPATAQMTEAATANGPPGTITPGGKKCYQFWYRDPVTSPCGQQFNLTNAVSVTWFP